MFKADEEKIHIMTDEEFAQNIDNITKLLESHRKTGFFNSFDSKKIYYEYFLCEDAVATVIIIHGLSEFTRKYYEMAYYFLNSKYNVFIYDQRCHGFSERLTDNVQLVHVEKFDDYVSDLEIFVDKIVVPLTSLPLYIYAHSMGGGVATMYMGRHPEKISKAVLSAPLYQPVVREVPYFLAKMHMKHKSRSADRCKPRVNTKFDPDAAIKHSDDEGRNRFLHNLNLRKNEPNYQSTPLTCCWVYNSLIILSTLKKEKTANKIKTPTLLISAEKDTVVQADKHRKFASACDAFTLHTIKDAGHSMMTSNHKIITDHVSATLNFFKN